MNSAEFSKWSRRMAFELGVFCRQERNRDAPDLKTLACSTDLEEALNNHRIPNPFWACIAILKKNTDYPREQIVMRPASNVRREVLGSSRTSSWTRILSRVIRQLRGPLWCTTVTEPILACPAILSYEYRPVLV